MQDSDLKLFKDLQYISDIIVLCLSGWSLLANGAVVVIYLSMKRSQKALVPNFMLLNQAIIDIITTVFAMLSTLPNFFDSWKEKKYYNVITLVCGDYSIFLSLGILMLISAERSLALHQPFLHFRIISLCKMFLSVILLWILSFIPCAVMVLFMKVDDHVATNEFYVIYASFRVGVVIVGITATLVVLFISSRTVRKSIRDSKRLYSLSKRLKDEDAIRDAENNRKEMRLITLLVIMSTVYATFYLPMGVFSIVRNIASKSLSFFEMVVMEIGLFILYISSAAVQPMLILFVKDDFNVLSVRCCCTNCSSCCHCETTNCEDSDVRVEILSISDIHD